MSADLLAVADPPKVTDWITAVCAMVTAPVVFTEVPTAAVFVRDLQKPFLHHFPE